MYLSDFEFYLLQQWKKYFLLRFFHNFLCHLQLLDKIKLYSMMLVRWRNCEYQLLHKMDKHLQKQYVQFLPPVMLPVYRQYNSMRLR